MKVTNMVCPQCDQTHGRDHLAACPQKVRDSRDYTRGWLAAREAYGRLAVEAADRERAKITRALSEVVALLERQS
jgi:hypothetical protein